MNFENKDLSFEDLISENVQERKMTTLPIVTMNHVAHIATVIPASATKSSQNAYTSATKIKYYTSIPVANTGLTETL